MTSILNDVKHMLGLLPDDDSFDSDVIIHINSVFGNLNQLGVGPTEGYMIEGADEEWENYLTDTRLNPVKSYMFLKVKMMFNPPTIAGQISAFERQIAEQEMRICWVSDYDIPGDVTPP